MNHTQGRVLLVGVLLALTLVACSDNRGGPRIVGEDGSTIDVTASTETATPSAEVSSTIVPSEGTPTATPGATETPAATGTATATPSGGTSSTAGDLEGVPYSTSDVRAAVESAGRTFLVVDDREPLCAGTSVEETTFWAASSGGSDYGPLWTLWVYPDSEAREDDWQLSEGELQPQVDDCEPPTGFNYFNANTVLVFTGWSGLGEESLYDENRSPGEDAAKEAFVAMSGGDED